jgi:hypothetical protein
LNDKNDTIILLKFIGSPLEDCTKSLNLKVNPEKYMILAKNNKILLLYLDRIIKVSKNNSFLNLYNEEIHKYKEQQITMINICKIFNKYNFNYAIFKSIKSFKAVPNDVDVIHFGTKNQYEKMIKILKKQNYYEVDSFKVDALQIDFHDARNGPHTSSYKKDIHDIDIYQEMSASLISYLNKNNFHDHIINVKFMETNIKILTEEANLLAEIVHSVIPEMIYTLSLFYETLYYLKKADLKNILLFIDIAKTNNVYTIIKTHFTITAYLHKIAFGYLPDKLILTLNLIGQENYELNKFINRKTVMPYKYDWFFLLKVFIEKLHDPLFIKSLFMEFIFILNKNNLRYFIYNLIWRASRDTY